MRYILIEFTKGLFQQAYQEVNERGVVVRYLDLNGDELELPEVTESKVLDDSPERPVWAV
jgi:hypothetical protein